MYKKIFIILFYCLIFGQSNADDLMKALSDAYYKNPELNAERENILVSKEDLKISRSEFLPSITITGSKSEQTTDKLTDRTGANTAITDVDTETQKIKIFSLSALSSGFLKYASDNAFIKSSAFD